MAPLCQIDEGHLGAGVHARADEMGNYHPSSEG
jgi:hypothetical protein